MISECQVWGNAEIPEEIRQFWRYEWSCSASQESLGPVSCTDDRAVKYSGLRDNLFLHSSAGTRWHPVLLSKTGALAPNGTYFAIKVAVTLRVTNAKGHVLRPASLGE